MFLQKIASILTKYRYCIIEIEGHTDNVPIHSAQYANNRELSAERARMVYEYIMSQMPPAEGVTDMKAYRSEMTSEFLAGYFLEESLSIDNIFVMIMIFVSFGIKKEYYHRVLFWGIFGAIVLRFIFIFGLGALVTKFSWLLAVFGVIIRRGCGAGLRI